MYKTKRERAKDITPSYSGCEELHTAGNLTVKVELIRDEHMGNPWEEHDGHGPVRESNSRDKRPGERPLMESVREGHWYYDWQEAIQIAKREWIGEGPYADGMTKGQAAEKAVQFDFDMLRGWLNDEWEWVGVAVILLDEDDNEIDHDSLWGIDSSSPEYINDTAREMAAELIVTYRKKQRISKLYEREALADQYGVAA